VTQQLQHLAGAYFHQDFDLDSGSPDSVIDSFIEGEGATSAAELVSEIDGLLDSDLTQSDMLDLWVNVWGASYDPSDGGQDMRVWLTEVRNRLSNGAT
jgi:hypothetical protein